MKKGSDSNIREKVSSSNKKANNKAGIYKTSGVNHKDVGVRVERRTRDMGVSDPVPDVEQSVVEYEKREDSIFRILIEDVKTHTSSDRQLVNVMWRVPGQDLRKLEESLVSLKNVSVRMFNNSDFVLYLRIQRPLAYVETPEYIGSWSPLGGKKNQSLGAGTVVLKPYEKLSFVVGNTSVRGLVSRRVSVDGATWIHFMSLLVTRDEWDLHGDVVTVRGIGLTVNLSANFRVNDGTVGHSNGFLLQTVKDLSLLDKVSPEPPRPVRVSQLFYEKDQDLVVPVNCLTIRERTNSQQKNILALFAQVKGVNSAEIVGLDHRVIYQLPLVVEGHAVDVGYITPCRHVRWSVADKCWVVGYLRFADRYIWQDFDQASDVYEAVITGLEMLTPVLFSNGTRVVFERRHQQGHLCEEACVIGFRFADPDDIELEGWFSTLLDTVLYVSKVVTVVVEAVVAAGLLESSKNIVRFRASKSGSHNE